MTLDPYQLKAISKLHDAVLDHVNTILTIPTGGGKSVIAAEFIRQIQDKKIIFVVHRIEICNQFSGHLKQIGIPHGMLTADISEYDSNRVIVASFDTLSARIRAGKIVPEPCIFICDECLTPNIKIGSKSISEINIGDSVLSYCEKSNKMVQSKVVRLFKNKFEGDLFVIISNGKRIVCTGNHPILTKAGWVNAQDIRRLDHELLHLRKRNGRRKAYMLKRMQGKKIVNHNVKNKYFTRKRKDEKKKSYAYKRDKGTSERYANTYWAQTENKRWERQSATGASDSNIQRNKEVRGSYGVCRKNKANNKRSKISKLLQAGYRDRIKKDRNRNRRPFPLFFKSEGIRPRKQNPLFEGSRIKNPAQNWEDLYGCGEAEPHYEAVEN